MKTVFGIEKIFHVILHTLGATFFKLKHAGHHFCGICREFAQSFWGFAKVFTDFAQISADFADFQEFCPDFHHIKTIGGALAPSPPYTTDISKSTVIARSKSVNLNKVLTTGFPKILVLSPNFQGGQKPVLRPLADAHMHNCSVAHLRGTLPTFFINEYFIVCKLQSGPYVKLSLKPICST